MHQKHDPIEEDAYFSSQNEKLKEKKPFWRQHFLKIYATIATILVIILADVAMMNVTHPSVQPNSPKLVSQPTSVPGTTPTQPSVSPTSPSSSPGTVLCHADWSSGMDGWSGGADWKQVSDMLVNDGTDTYNGFQDSVVLAPCQLTTDNYSVEVTIQYVRYGWGFGILARGGGGNGYKAWVTTDGIADFNVAAITLASESPSDEYGADALGESLAWTDKYQIDTAWHTYRFDLKDATLTLFIDGQKILTTTDTQYLSPGRVGLAVNHGSQIDVKSFQVTAL